MPLPDVQACAFFATKLNKVSDLIFIDTYVHADTFTPQPDSTGKLTTNPVEINLLLYLRFFGAPEYPVSNIPASAQAKSTLLSRGDTVNVKIRLSKCTEHAADCIGKDLFETTIDLSLHEPETYHPANGAICCPYYSQNLALPLSILDFPDYGQYLLKVLLRTPESGDDYFIQSVTPITVQPRG